MVRIGGAVTFEGASGKSAEQMAVRLEVVVGRMEWGMPSVEK